MSFKDLPFHQRVHSLGDESEAKYLEVAPLGNSEEFGWRRPAVSMARMSPFIRHKPDFYASSGHLVECMGCGRDGLIKLKLDKYQALLDWNKQQEVAFWVWNSATSEWLIAPMTALKRHVAKSRRAGRIKAFENDGNEYYEIPFADLYGDEETVGGTW